MFLRSASIAKAKASQLTVTISMEWSQIWRASLRHSFSRHCSSLPSRASMTTCCLICSCRMTVKYLGKAVPQSALIWAIAESHQSAGESSKRKRWRNLKNPRQMMALWRPSSSWTKMLRSRRVSICTMKRSGPSRGSRSTQFSKCQLVKRSSQSLNQSLSQSLNQSLSRRTRKLACTRTFSSTDPIWVLPKKMSADSSMWLWGTDLMATLSLSIAILWRAMSNATFWKVLQMRCSLTSVIMVTLVTVNSELCRWGAARAIHIRWSSKSLWLGTMASLLSHRMSISAVAVRLAQPCLKTLSRIHSSTFESASVRSVSVPWDDFVEC